MKNGPNALEVVAVNTDGRSPLKEAVVVVSYTYPAVLVSIDLVELMTDKGDVERVLLPTYRSKGEVSFPETPRSLVWLVGRVRWSDPEAKALNEGARKVIAERNGARVGASNQ